MGKGREKIGIYLYGKSAFCNVKLNEYRGCGFLFINGLGRVSTSHAEAFEGRVAEMS